MTRPFKPRHRRNVMTPEIMAAWVRFLRHAEKAVKNPDRHGLAFARAADRVGSLLLPPSQNERGSALVRLVRLGKGFAVLKGEARDAAVIEARGLAIACRALFQPATGADGQGDREPRRDIFG